MDANVVQEVSGATNLLQSPISLIVGIVLIIITILFLVFFGKFLINSIIGIAGVIICLLFGIKLPVILTIIVSGIFGLGGLGVILILKFFGIL